AVRPASSISAPADPWRAFGRELDAWAAAGRHATFWWRDDDAVAPTAELERLLGLAAGTPLALAVIPARSDGTLARRLAGERTVTVLQHGWTHTNHASPGARKAEFGPHRPTETMAAELSAGRARMAALFGSRALPVLVPPWNRLAPALLPLLPGLGFAGLSMYGVRPEPAARPMWFNTHLDPVAWRGGRGFAGDAAVVGMALDHLRARRLGLCDPAEPTGLLTHHLVADEGCWAFIGRLLDETRRHPAARWLAAEELFPISA